jgi:4-amino-4-deoxy-L-arabinose transferase-like glycosyltransferase
MRSGDLNLTTQLAEPNHGTTDTRRTAANYDVSAERHLTAARTRDSAFTRVPTTLLVILVVALFIRIAILMLYGNQPMRHDETDYNTLAVNLVEHHEFALTPGVPTSLRPPLYPLLVAGIYDLFGSENWRAVRIAQALLSLVTVYVVFRLGSNAYSRQVGLIAAGIMCFYPSLLWYNNLLLSEVLCIFLLSAALLAISRALQDASLWSWAGVGVLIGLTALTRSVFWLLPLVLAASLIAVGPWRIGRRIASAATMLTAFCLVLAPWSVRNSLLQQTFVVVDVMAGRNLMMGNYEYTPAYRAWDAISNAGEMSWNQVLFSKSLLPPGTTQGKLDKIAMRYGFKYMLTHPLETSERTLVKLVNFWQLEREVVKGSMEGDFGSFARLAWLPIALSITACYIATVFLATFGILLSPPANWRLHVAFVLLIALVCGLHTITFAHSRYHLPLIPVLSIYAAAAAAHLRDILQRRRSWQFIAACVVCLALTFSWVWEVFWVDPGRYLAVAAHGRQSNRLPADEVRCSELCLVPDSALSWSV